MQNKGKPQIKVKGFIGQLFCKHEWQWTVETMGEFFCISGERRVRVCTKCGKKGGSYFAEYEGGGYK